MADSTDMASVAASKVLAGIDENGLGPRLGPLVVTAVMAQGPADLEAVLAEWRRRAAERVGDSKALVAHGQVALARAWAHALVARGAGRPSESSGGPLSLDELLHAVALDDRTAMREPCPASAIDQCWATGHDDRLLGRAGPSASLRAEVERDLDWLEQQGVHVRAVRSIVVCTLRLNAALRSGESRLLVDLHAMERLALALRDLAGQELSVVCGKVGGYRDYGKAFGPLGDRLYGVVEQERRRSCYRFPGLGEICFEQDADASHALVGLASLVGKLLRELLMGRIVEHYRSVDPSLPDASGYNDPVTDRFVRASAPIRRSRAVPSDCFERLTRPKRPTSRRSAGASPRGSEPRGAR